MRLKKRNYLIAIPLLLMLFFSINCGVWEEVENVFTGEDEDLIIEEGEEDEWKIITIVDTFPYDSLVEIFAITNFVRAQDVLQKTVEDHGLLDEGLQEDYKTQLLQLATNPSEYEIFYLAAINYFINRELETKIKYYQSKGAVNPNKNIFFGTDELKEDNIKDAKEYYKVHYKKTNLERDNLVLQWEFISKQNITLVVCFDENRQALKKIHYQNNKPNKAEYFIASRRWITVRLDQGQPHDHQ